MNCQQVEAWLGEAARGHEPLGDTNARRHIAGCPRCAARLEAEQLTNAALNALAAHDAEASAPPRIETALLAAFRARAESIVSATERAVPARTRRPVWLWASRARFALTALAVAAAVALLFVAALRFRLTPGRTTQTAIAEQSAPPETSVQPTQTSSPSPAPLRDEQAQNVSAPDSRQAVARRPAHKERTRAGRAQAAARSGRDVRATTLETVGEMLIVAPREDAESVTDFVPLVASGAPPLASGQLVRVKLPRSALNALGLPLNLSRAGGAVQADVLLGDDGLARAIRLVRQRGESF
jgi:hypothetical protein